MPHYGPWQQNPDVVDRAAAAPTAFHWVDNNHGTASDSFNGVDQTWNIGDDVLYGDNSGSTGGVDQIRLAVSAVPVATLPLDDTNPLDYPPHAIGVEYDPGDPGTLHYPLTAQWQPHGTYSAVPGGGSSAAPPGFALELRRLLAADYTIVLTPFAVPRLASWLDPAAAAARTLLTSTTPVPAAFDPSWASAFSFDIAAADVDPSGYVGLWAAPNYYTGSLPTPGVIFSGQSSARVLYSYRPPRFRFVYDIAPPQRQFPRDDGLAMSTSRSWPPPTSQQFSQRRGPASYL